MLKALYAFPEIDAVKANIDVRRADNKRVVNDAEVQKEAHDALLPTGVVKDPASLGVRERNIYWLVCKRLAEQFLPDAVDLKTTMTVSHPDAGGYTFKADGSVVVDNGFRVLSKERSQAELPDIKQGAVLKAKSIGPVECATRPARRFTQASTRAKIISEIIHYGYVEEKKDGLYITDSGREYVEALEGIGITDPIFAANLDMQIKRVQRGEESYDNAYNAVIESLKVSVKKAFTGAECGATDIPCPSCGSFLKAGQWDYTCGCGFKSRRKFCGHTITPAEMKVLLAGGVIGPFHLKSMKGKKFDAKLVLKDGKISFPDESEKVDVRCPKCGGSLTAGQYSYTCGCGFKTSRLVCGHTVMPGELEKLLSGDEIGSFDMKGKSGKAFSSRLKMKDDYSLEFVFEKRASGKGGRGEETSLKCPACGRPLKKDRYSYVCECGFKASHSLCGVDLLEKDVASLLAGEKIGPFNFTSKKGKRFQAYLCLEDGGIKFEFA